MATAMENDNKMGNAVKECADGSKPENLMNEHQRALNVALLMQIRKPWD